MWITWQSKVCIYYAPVSPRSGWNGSETTCKAHTLVVWNDSHFAYSFRASKHTDFFQSTKPFVSWQLSFIRSSYLGTWPLIVSSVDVFGYTKTCTCHRCGQGCKNQKMVTTKFSNPNSLFFCHSANRTLVWPARSDKINGKHPQKELNVCYKCCICRCEHARSWCDIFSTGQRTQKPGDSICSSAEVQRLYRCGDTFFNFTLDGNYSAVYSNPIIMWDSLLGSQKDKMADRSPGRHCMPCPPCHEFHEKENINKQISLSNRKRLFCNTPPPPS